MQLEALRRANGVALTMQQVNRALEAYLIWLFGGVLFTTPHGDTIDARWIAVAREIADAHTPADVTLRSWGSAMLAYTFHALSTVCFKREGRPTLKGYPLLLQLRCYERLQIGQPNANSAEPYGLDFYADGPALVPFAGPTFGSLWTRRQVCFEHQLQ